MTALYIIGGILLFLLILLLCPLRAELDYREDQVLLNLKYLFFRFQLVPAKEKKAKPKKQSEKKEKPQPEKKKSNPVADLKDQYGLEGLITLVKEIVRIVTEVLRSAARHLVIKELAVRGIIVGSDGADTALKYGYACSVIYPAVSLLDNKARLKKYSVNLQAGFLAEKTKVELIFHASMKPLFLIGITVAAVFRFLKLMIRMKKQQLAEVSQ